MYNNKLIINLTWIKALSFNKFIKVKFKFNSNFKILSKNPINCSFLMIKVTKKFEKQIKYINIFFLF